MPEEIVDVSSLAPATPAAWPQRSSPKKASPASCSTPAPSPTRDKDTEAKPAYTLPIADSNSPANSPTSSSPDEFNANTWVDEKEVPYTYDPGKTYNWVRVRLFGGRSLFWSRQSFRLSDYEFKGKSHDGYGDDWPISLADLAPYYARVEHIFRVRGHADNLPQYPDGNFVPDDSPWTGCIAALRRCG